ncbi:MAG: tryptophan 2,3-dioxygenase [Planctomycetia bacterium]|nr:MAG: tryptophan 2,3-dioxygenase [Planctomycetia bacterium]
MALTYASYLKIDELLSLQSPRSEPPEHDETLFIIIHQTYELWFKQTLHELDRLKLDLSANRLYDALATLKRVRMILKTIVAQLDILETMTPMSFASFRERLDTASGFQSMQFRELEFVLGFKRADMLKYYPPGTHGYDAVLRRLHQRTLTDHLCDFLAQQGARIPPEVRDRDVVQPAQPSPALQEELLKLYRTRPDVVLLLELLMDIDEGLQEWRYRHVKIVERTIGSKQGTGGSLGVEFLKKSLFQPVFADLWAIRVRL